MKKPDTRNYGKDHRPRHLSQSFGEGGAVGDDYNTELSPEDETDFQTWKGKNAPRDSGADYDLRGAYKDKLQPAENGHWPDTYKKPNHPTFSNQSKYAPAAPDKAGSWDGDTYIPPGKGE
jgi:hypothetical protein